MAWESTLPIFSWKTCWSSLKCAERLSNETHRAVSQLSVSFSQDAVSAVNFQKPKVEWKRIVHGFQFPEPMEAPPLAG
jgi:hypothetical protein